MDPIPLRHNRAAVALGLALHPALICVPTLATGMWFQGSGGTWHASLHSSQLVEFFRRQHIAHRIAPD